MSELRIQGLNKAFGEHSVLHGIDLTVERGTLFALLGPSGSGKTTLLRVLCGFERADAGTIDIDERRVAGPNLHVPTEARRIGYVPQEGALFPHLSVAENIVFGLPRAERRARHRVAELLELVGLPDDYATRAPQQLSGGQQQRVALARALAPSPRLVMLDEPFSSLDAALRVETREAVARALAASYTTAVLVTHDQAEALSLGQRVAVLWKGRLVQSATPQIIYSRPATRELAAFIGEAVLLEGLARDGIASCALGEIPLLAPVENGRVDIMLRPEQIRVVDEHAAHQDSHEARVSDVRFNGREAMVRLDMPGVPGVPCVPCVQLRATVPGHRAPCVNDLLRIRVDGAALAYSRT